MISSNGISKNQSSGKMRYLKRNWQLYLFLLLPVVYFIVFKYIPMYGIQIAFKDYSPKLGFWRSSWVGFDHFFRFFRSYYFNQVLVNTITISLYSLVLGFPMPIMLALMLNEVNERARVFKKAVQTITYAPHFISMVVMCSMISLFLSPTYGIVNKVIEMSGGEAIYFLGTPEMFKTIFVISGIWQNTGWASIIYIAALSGIDPALHQAAQIDGAGRLRRIWHINLPGITPTIVILLIMRCGSIMSVGFEKVFLLQNDLNRSASDVIATLVYRQGLILADFSFSTAVGLFNTLINLGLLFIVNYTARKLTETSFW